MEQLRGFVTQGKAIYGSKQSPRAWFDKSSAILLSFGFRRCNSDHSVLLILCVDDIIHFDSDGKVLKKWTITWKIPLRQRISGCNIICSTLKLHMVEVRLFWLEGSMYWICLMKSAC